MLTSQQGTGKGKLYSILERLLCSQTVSCSSFDDFTNRFTVALHETLLCLLDDVVAKGDKQMSTLKSKITEKRQKFEAKGQQPIQENCFTRIFLASNEKDRCVSIWVIDVGIVLLLFDTKNHPLRLLISFQNSLIGLIIKTGTTLFITT